MNPVEPASGWLVSQGEATLNEPTNAELRHELDRVRQQLADMVSGAITIEDIAIQNGVITLQAGTELARVMACQFREIVKDAANYVEMKFHDGEGGKILVTVQKCEGKTPHQLRMIAEKELATLKGEIQANG